MIKKILKLDPDFQFLLFLLVYALICTAVPVVALRLYGDMVEMFIWGKEFQWGYHKHPPFAAWLSGIWFYIFPTNKFSYFFFAQVNVAIGLVFSYLLSQQFLDKKKSLVSILMLGLVIIFTCRGMRYNNDAILLSVWPCCAFFTFKAFQRDNIVYWSLAGFTSGIAMLSKYYSALLLVAMFLIFIFNNRKDIANKLPKLGPITCFLVFCAVTLPHFYWLLEHDFMPIKYINVTKGSDDNNIAAIWSFILTQILIVTPVILLGKFLFKINYKEMLIPDISTKDKVFLSGIIYIPFVLTILLGIRYHIVARFGLPLWFLFGTFIVSKSRAFSDRSVRIVTIVVYLILIISLVLAPLVKVFRITEKQEKQLFPAQKIADIITKEWRDLYKTNLKYIAGRDDFSIYNISFYSADHPSVLIDFDYKISTWIDSEDQIKKNGIAVVCYSYDVSDAERRKSDNCMKEAQNHFRWVQIQWKKIILGQYNFDYAFIPSF